MSPENPLMPQMTEMSHPVNNGNGKPKFKHKVARLFSPAIVAFPVHFDEDGKPLPEFDKDGSGGYLDLNASGYNFNVFRWHFAPGAEIDTHYHLGVKTETIVVTQGELLVKVGDAEPKRYKTGDIITFDAYIPHYCKNPTKEQTNILVIFSPPHRIADKVSFLQ